MARLTRLIPEQVLVGRGLGRQPGKDGMETMRDHRQAALAAR